eukprot:TRINITY_DN1435_c0_g1_i1.p1 TRINITY_DN1435_c0_g1~~TRINITY_DN1435_c0_g1_i1.p1  ORF type:complete len:373 (-),score=41.27 TRINITY_DN1435_c0_g1_i1:94-1212(-)
MILIKGTSVYRDALSLLGGRLCANLDMHHPIPFSSTASCCCPRKTPRGRGLRIMINISHFAKSSAEPNPKIYADQHVIPRPYAQDSVAHARAQLFTALELCEMGAEVVVHFDCAYDCGGEPDLAAFEGSCSTPEALELAFHQHDPSLGYHVTGVHRARVADSVNDFDVFMYTEDDVLYTAGQILLYVDHQRRLLSAGLGMTHNVGFYRVEVNVTSSALEEAVFEETRVGPEGLDVLQLPVPALHPGSGGNTSHGTGTDGNSTFEWPWYVIYRGNTYQGSWLLLQPQLRSYIKELEGARRGPRRGLIRETNANWVYWLLQKQKVIPLASFSQFGVRHLGNYYLWTTKFGDNARSTHQLQIELLQLRARRELEG